MQTSRTVQSDFASVVRSKPSLLAAVAMMFASACDPGSEEAPPNMGDPGCMAELTMSGTFVPPNGQPPTVGEGCVPLGTWNVQVATLSKGTCNTITAKPAYSYVVALESPPNPRSQTIKYLGQLDPMEEVTTNMTAGGNGQCEATFTHVLPATGTSYHQIVLKPYFEEGTTALKGKGAYELWPTKP